MLLLAKNTSSYSDYKIKVGAVIVRHGTPISVGFNKAKTHSKSAKLAMTLHAEHAAILASNGANLRGASIYVYRQTKAGLPALAKPCGNCTGLLRTAGFRWMIYTVGDYPYFRVERL